MNDESNLHSKASKVHLQYWLLDTGCRGEGGRAEYGQNVTWRCILYGDCSKQGSGVVLHIAASNTAAS